MSSFGECPNKRWTDERRERVAVLHRLRHGAPLGFSTVWGMHVPSEHEKPVRYWANWLKHNQGLAEAQGFIRELEEDGWARVSALREMWERKKKIGENREVIRKLAWEAYRVDQNSR